MRNGANDARQRYAWSDFLLADYLQDVPRYGAGWQGSYSDGDETAPFKGLVADHGAPICWPGTIARPRSLP
jgi:hypothetical protein